MANNFDEVIRLAIEVGGAKDVVALQNALQAVGDSGSDAAPKAKALADQLAKLTDQNTLITTLVKEKAALQETGDALALQKLKLADLQKQLDETTEPSAALQRSFDKTQQSVTKLNAAYNLHQATITKTNNALAAAGVSTTNLDAAQRQVQSSMAGVISKATTLTGNLGNTAKASLEAKDGISQLREVLTALVGVVGFEKLAEGLQAIVEEGEKFDDLKKQFATAFGGLEEGEKTLEQVRDLAKGVPQSFEDVSAAAIALQKAGINPLNGSLQALLDNASATNQSQEQLQKTIEDLGRASIKGQVDVKALVTLTQDGIPVFDLLGKAMGVSADRVRELANSGQLSAKSIQLLVQQLGQLRAGAAANELGDFDSQMTKLRDSVKEFLEEIAGSGALEVFRQALKNLNAEVDDAAKSGKLKELAQSISDGIVSTAGAVKSAIGFVIDYAGALKQLAAAYITVRAINIGSNILSGASAMLTAANATKAAAGEAEAATGIFGKLGAFIKGIPSVLKISVLAVGIDLVLEGLNSLISARKEQIRLEHDTRDAALANVEANAKLQVSIEKVKQATKQYADVAIESNERLKTQSAEQLVAYEKQLEGARKFYNALSVQAAQAGDSLALKDANAHLDAINAEIAKVNAQLAVTRSVGADAAKGLSQGASEFVSKLTELGTDAKAIGETIEKAFAGFDLKRQVTEVGDFAVGLDTVAAKGGKTAQILDSTLLESLKKLSGQDLLQFQSDAIASISELGDKAQSTSEVLKATLETALDRLGVKAQDTGTKITKSGADIIATFTAVSENAQATSKTIVAAFDAAIIGAKTIDELNSLKGELEAVGATGKVSFTDMANATRDFDERVRTVTASLNPLASQFELLGIKSQAQLNAVRDNAQEAFQAIVIGAQKGQAAQEDVTRAFAAFVTAARAAAADSSQSAKDTLEEQLSVLASVNNLTDQFNKMGESGKAAGEKTATSFRDAKGSIDDAKKSTDDLKDSTDDAADASSKIGDNVKKSGAQVIEAIGGIIPITEQASSALTQMNEIIARQGTLANVSLDQAKFLLTSLGALAGAQTEVLQKRIEDLEAAAEKAQEVADQMASQAAEIQDQIDELKGDDVSIEDRRHQKALQDAKDEAQKNNTLNTAAYQNLVKLENQLHLLKLQHIKEQQAANDSGSGSSSSNGTGSGNGTSNGTSSRPSNVASSGAIPPVQIHFHGDIVGTDAKSLANYLRTAMAAELKSLQAMSRVNILTGKPN
jgi:tape measure domain-containing protein